MSREKRAPNVTKMEAVKRLEMLAVKLGISLIVRMFGEEFVEPFLSRQWGQELIIMFKSSV